MFCEPSLHEMCSLYFFVVISVTEDRRVFKGVIRLAHGSRPQIMFHDCNCSTFSVARKQFLVRKVLLRIKNDLVFVDWTAVCSKPTSVVEN